MIEIEARVQSDIPIAGVLCLPEDATASGPVPAVLLLGGTGGDTRDGDMAPSRTPGIHNPPKRGLLRRFAHDLASVGIASLRCDKRGCGESGGRADESNYDTDLVDNTAAFRWLQARAEIRGDRIAVAGHSAGALNACLLCRDIPEVAAAGMLGALSGPIDELVRWNWPRIATHWEAFSAEQRAWLLAERPREVVGAFQAEAFITAALAGEDRVTLGAQGITQEFDTVRFRQDYDRPCLDEFRHVRCPALVLHGGSDMNVKVEDALATYQALRAVPNDDVTLVIVPGVDHSYQPVDPDPIRRLWDRVTLATFARPVSPLARSAFSSWCSRTLGAAG
ncbi:MAG: alpha/beta hydrolase family protein [Dehalococcoidia bacterium]